jgi:hypothetical protein
MRTVLALALVAGTACGRLPAAASYTTLDPTPPSLTPPALVPPPPPRRTRSYAATMVVYDAALLMTFLPALSWADDDTNDSESAVALGYTAAFLLGGPLIHKANGNDEQVGSSFLRRAGYTALGGLGGGLIGSTLFRDFNEEVPIGTLLGVVVGIGLGAVTAAIHDWAKARI